MSELQETCDTAVMQGGREGGHKDRDNGNIQHWIDIISHCWACNSKYHPVSQAGYQYYFLWETKQDILVGITRKEISSYPSPAQPGYKCWNII